MADDKRGREKQSDDAERRQRERDINTARERGDEPEPPLDDETLADVEIRLQGVSFPATGAEVVAAAGELSVDTGDGDRPVAALVPDTESERFDTVADVRRHVERPTVAAAMKRVLEAADRVQHAELGGSQRDAYEKTFRELAAVDTLDEDEGVGVVTEWIVDRITEKGKLPGSRDVRRQAAKVCRASGYEIRNDEWLGV